MEKLLQTASPGQWLTGVAVGGFLLGLFALVLGYRFKRASLSKRPPAFWFCIVMWSVSILGGAAAVAFFPTDDNGLTLMYAGVSAMMLLIMLSLPAMHRKSGFKPAEFHVKLAKLGQQHEAVLQELRSFFEMNGFQLFDATAHGFSFLAVPSLKSLPSWNPHVGQIRAFVKVERASWDAAVDVVVDTKEYVMSLTWEREATHAVTMQVEQFIRARYPEAIDSNSIVRV